MPAPALPNHCYNVCGNLGTLLRPYFPLRRSCFSYSTIVQQHKLSARPCGELLVITGKNFDGKQYHSDCSRSKKCMRAASMGGENIYTRRGRPGCADKLATYFASPYRFGQRAVSAWCRQNTVFGKKVGRWQPFYIRLRHTFRNCRAC